MAISKEKLKDLILKGVKIYDSWHGNEFCVRDIEKIEDDVVTYSFLLDEYRTTLEDLHEDYEYFKWYEEFGCIERVERLKLPSFKEINKNFSKEIETSFYEDDSHLFFITPFGDIVINNYDNFKVNEIFRKPLTKENYTIACRKAKELFLKGDK